MLSLRCSFAMPADELVAAQIGMLTEYSAMISVPVFICAGEHTIAASVCAGLLSARVAAVVQAASPSVVCLQISTSWCITPLRRWSSRPSLIWCVPCGWFRPRTRPKRTA